MPVDPTTTTLLVAEPSGTIQELDAGDLEHVGTGVYALEVDTTGKPGLWRYRFVGTGAAQAAADRSFIVDAATVAGS